MNNEPDLDAVDREEPKPAYYVILFHPNWDKLVMRELDDPGGVGELVDKCLGTLDRIEDVVIRVIHGFEIQVSISKRRAFKVELDLPEQDDLKNEQDDVII